MIQFEYVGLWADVFHTQQLVLLILILPFLPASAPAAEAD